VLERAQKIKDFGITSAYQSDLSSLDFNEFTLLDDEGESPPAGSEWDYLLFQYLQKHFGVADMSILPPFLILRCETLPEPDLRPFTISRYIAVWLDMDEPMPPIIPGLMGGQIDYDKFIEVDESLEAGLKPAALPKPETLLKLLEVHFPNAVAISRIFSSIVVEFDPETWKKTLESLPCAFRGLPFDLAYTNGMIANAEFKRLKRPRPGTLKDMVVDDSDYVSESGSFNPGAMLCSDRDDTVTAGIMVQKGTENRLAVALPAWDDEYKKVPSKLGDPQHFRVKQGATDVGYITELIPSTDIGLAKLSQGLSFSNRFLEIDAIAKVLIPWEEVQYRDQFCIDSYTAGRQFLVCAGTRVLSKKKSEDFVKGRKDNPPDGKYTIPSQGIFATNDPKILSTLELRAGICGCALLRIGRRNETLNRADRGEICGIMHWADLQMKYSAQGNFFAFANPVDPLINHGWNCA
jgi:hypothetical protein